MAIVGALIKEALARKSAVLMTAHGALAIEGVELERFELSRGSLAAPKAETRTGRLRSLLGG